MSSPKRPSNGSLLLARTLEICSRYVKRAQIQHNHNSECHLAINRPVADGDNIHLSARFLRPGMEEAQIWFKVPSDHRSNITERADPFILAAIFAAAEAAPLLRVVGAVTSPSLLRNLKQFQVAWCAWRGYKITTIEAESAPEEVSDHESAIAAFSGGVDLAFTAYRHIRGHLSERENLTTALMVHGFDIPLNNVVGFDRAVGRATAMLDSLGIPLIVVRTNIREFLPNWEMMHGAAVASTLALTSVGFSAGLIPSTGTYQLPFIPWGSNPLTDPLLGFRGFPLIHDGTASSRLDKVRALCGWPEALHNLRFCWQNAPAESNCGRCLKCILTALEFECCGVKPSCFVTPVTDEIIVDALSRYQSDPHGDVYFTEVLRAATAQGMDPAWLPALRHALHSLSLS